MFAYAALVLGYTIAPGGLALGALVLAAAAALAVVPFLALWKVSEARGQSRAYVWWGLLGIPGLVVGLVMMLAMPTGTASTTQRPM